MDKPIHVRMKIGSGIDLGCLQKCEIANAFGQLVGPRHYCLSNQDGNDGDVVSKCDFQFDTDPIGIFRYPGTSLFSSEPPIADNCNQRIAMVDRIFDVVAKIFAGRDSIDVHEHRSLPVVLAQAIVNPAAYRARIVAAIGNRDDCQ